MYSLSISGFLVGCNSWVMTNVNDTEADLELTLGSTNQWKNSNTTSGVGVGAGANANSRSGMTVVGSDTLAELVWSPRTGLNIKFAEKTPCFMLEVGPSDMGFLQLEDTQTEKQVSDGHPVASLAACRVSGEVFKSSSYTGTYRNFKSSKFIIRFFIFVCKQTIFYGNMEQKPQCQNEQLLTKVAARSFTCNLT